MKKMVVWMLMGILMGLPVYADQVDNELPGVEDGLKAQTREMIQAGVNAEDAIGLTRAMVQQQFSPQQMTQAREMVMTAAQKGLPVAPISNKANEGAAKNVSADRIVGAMNQGERALRRGLWPGRSYGASRPGSGPGRQPYGPRHGGGTR